MADNTLAATVDMLGGSAESRSWQENNEDMASFVQEDEGMSPCFSEVPSDFQSNLLMRTLCPASLPFRDRLARATPARDVQSALDWTALAAAETTEALARDAEDESAGKVEINSGGQVFFGLLSSTHGEQAVVLKFCNNRYILQSEQMAAELARQLGVPGPASRILLKPHDTAEWEQLSARALEVCPPLAEVLQKKMSMLLLQFVPGQNLESEVETFQGPNLVNACHNLGRLFILDLLLGNADRLPLHSLGWRGNPGNVLWSDGRCVPIDAVVARRPPKLLVREMDQKAAWLLELVLLDRASAQQVLMEAFSCNAAAAEAVSADWASNENAWAERHGGKAAVEKAGAMSSVKAFNEGAKAALAAAVQEQGLLEMMTDVVHSWIENFRADLIDLRANSPSRPQLKLGNTAELRDLSQVAMWQDLLREKTQNLAKAVDEWAARRELRASFSFRGFLGESVLNPVADAYELLVRLRQLTSRIKVLHMAGSVSRPADLAPKAPLFVGGATSLCLHVLRKLGVTHILNCTEDLPAPSEEELGDLNWRRLALPDHEDQDLSETLKSALQVIAEAEEAGGKILVHCHEGKSRSVSVCLAYLISRQMPLADALAYVKSKRPIARPNAGFLRQLMSFELETLGTNSTLPEELLKGKPVLSSRVGRTS
ncbi:Dual specificity protein phosphatase PHS1 [Symbiodinium microadriaticum]|uniref:Dual specificity protein phosphatase PHS1 n=1 Tax=Symbiodinium microadriaticum TaxID=2951 RepID=A0A1Q9E5I9_SYMMI|nr:Dual specificity protein phosphatase PHS1 [Symbiodinium microadriaticum]CAE7469986.1 PHS1 [Symbiodinium microadriaticum]